MAQIKLKRGPSSNITSVILEAGEPAVTEDNDKLYIGRANGTKFLVNPDVPPSSVTSVAGRTGAVVLASADVGLGNVNNTSDANKPVSTAQQTALDLRELKANKGAANGYAPLDSNTKIPLANVPDVLLGQVLYGGTWNAATAVATLSNNAKTRLGTASATITLTNNTTAITGYAANEAIYYITSTAGTFASIAFDVGDWLISIGSAWKKIDNTDAVTGVKGNAEGTYRIGNVNITAANIGADSIKALGFLNADSVIDGGTF